MRVKRLRSDATLPTKGSREAAGLDLYACLSNSIILAPMSRVLIPCGIAMEIPFRSVGMICPRSGLARDFGLTVLNAPGIIDSDYRGEIKVMIVNLGLEECEIKYGDRVAQLVICPIMDIDIEEVDYIGTTVRGSNGFGSTGR